MAVHLIYEDCFYIEKRRIENVSMSAIGRELERRPSSVSRELNFNTPDDFNGLYCSWAADKLAKVRRTDGAKSKAFKATTLF